MLTVLQVREIKAALSVGVGRRQVAEQYGVHRDTVALIDRGKTWKHVQ